MRIRQFYLPFGIVLFFLFSCNKPNNYSNFNAEVVKEWTLNVRSANENHATDGIVKSSELHIKLFSDNTIRFDILVEDLATAGDGIVTIQINAGDPVSDGPLLLDLNPRISGAYASGIIQGRKSLTDSLLNSSIDTYVNLITAKAPEGLLRSPLNTEIVFTKNVQLSGADVVPTVNTATSGVAYLRVTADHKLYSRITISNDEGADPVNAATINQGNSTSNGAVITSIAASAADFNLPKQAALSDAIYTSILGDDTYVTVSSSLNPNGKLRGQIR